jgi:carboxypeptidase PM20D1
MYYLIPAILLFFGAFLLVRAYLFSRPPLPPEESELPVVDRERLVVSLGDAIRCETISLGEGLPPEAGALFKLHTQFQLHFPLVHTQLKRESIDDFNLLYTWEGQQPELAPVLLTAHQDVVPVDPDQLDAWQQPPFSGALVEDFVWGRGALDTKSSLIAILEAVEDLLAAGYRPQRTILLAFGFDEEVGGLKGARRIAEKLEERNLRPMLVLDEGGAVVDGVMPGFSGPVALVGNAEKGYLSLMLTASGPQGHSSAPPRQSAIGILSNGLAELEANPLPAHLDTLKDTYREAGFMASFGMQMIFANLWLFGRLVRRQLDAAPQTSAAIRTTTALTRIEGGIKDNVLPAQARAVVNFRLYPGDSIASVCDRVRRIIADERVQLEVLPDAGWEASPVSSTNTLLYAQLSSAIRQVYPQAAVAPYLVQGSTDARHYTGLCEQVFRFSPYLITREELETVHGVNERISVENLEHMAQFYALVMRAWGGEESRENEGSLAEEEN